MSNIYTIPNYITTFDGSNIPNTNTITAVNFESGSQCTVIADNAFLNWTALVSIDFSNANINSIGNSAFYNCKLLTLTIPKSVTEIYYQAFYGNSNLSSLTFEDSSSIESIGAFAFANCNLSTIQYYISSTPHQGFPLSLNIIGDNISPQYGPYIGYSFINNFNLDISTFVFNSTITIHYFSFYNCLNSTINSSNTSPNITLLPPDKPFILTSTNSIVTDGILQPITDDNYTSISFDSTFTLLNCTSLGAYTFVNWVSLQSIDFTNVGNALINLGESTFSPCFALSNIIIPPTVKIINNYCFQFSGLHGNIIIPSSVVSINSSSFLQTLVTSVTIQNSQSAVTIARDAFPPNTQIIYTIYTIPNTVISFNGLGILNTNFITTVNFQSGSQCITITDNAFYNWTSLVSIDFSNSIIISIGNNVFENCTSLLSFTLPETVVSIGNFAFNSCLNLVIVNMSNNTTITFINDNAFSNCTSLTTLYFPENCPSFTTIPTSCCSGNTSLTNVTFGNYISIIGNNAFENCTSLHSFTLPNTITSIGNFAFNGCLNLIIVNMLNTTTITSIGTNAFSNCTGLTTLYFPENCPSFTTIPASCCSNNTLLTTVTLGNYISTIGNYAFENCTSLQTFTLPNTIASIGNFAFNGCLNLITIDMSNNTTITSIGANAFSNCTGLTTLYFPENSKLFTTIPASCCSGNTSLTTVTFGKYISIISNGAFQNCNLSTLTIPNSVTKIYDNAFYGNSNLSPLSFNIPSSVVSINSGSFLNTGITVVTVQNIKSAITIASDAFPPNTQIIFLSSNNGDSSGSSGLPSCFNGGTPFNLNIPIGRITNRCIYDTEPSLNTNIYQKYNVLQYKQNSSMLTNNQKYTQKIKGLWSFRTKSFATQSQTYTNNNTRNLYKAGSVNLQITLPNGSKQIIQDGGTLTCINPYNI